MHKTLLKAVGLLACMAWLGYVNAATMSGINVSSALGHPLKAEISLAELGKTDKTALVAKLASVNEFKSAGIDFPYGLPKLSFEVSTRANGEVYIKLTSTQPVNEPFVSLLIELSWPSGKLLREYTFLLDPTSFVPEQPKMAEVKPVEPIIPEPVPVLASVPDIQPVVPEIIAEKTPTTPTTPAESEPAVVALPVESQQKAEEKSEQQTNGLQKVEVVAAEPVPAIEPLATAESATEPAIVAEQTPMAEPHTSTAEAGRVEPAETVKMEPLAPSDKTGSSDTILVEKGDTLGKIADEVKPVDVSLERMLVAMYRANIKIFDGKNMNRIRAGKILHMPETVDIDKVTQTAAIKEIRAQVADWQDYRQKLAATQTTSTSDQEAKQQSTGKINAAVAEKAPVIKDTAKEVLRLSKGEALGDKTVVGGNAKNNKENQIAKADEAAAKRLQLLEEQKKISQLEDINKEASKLVELKGAPEVSTNVEEKKVEPGLTPVSPASAVTPVEEPAADFDIMAIVNKYMDILLADPILLAGGVAVLLGLGGMGYGLLRRNSGIQKKSGKKFDDLGGTTGNWRAPVMPSPDTGDFTQSSLPSAQMSVASALEDVDPISEADLFLNFGRDSQAEEILKDALSKNPSNIQVKLKLLSIYVNRKDRDTFSKYAQDIKESGDEAAWERAAVMGREVDPDNPIYNNAKGEIRHRDTTSKAEVDFDLGMSKSGVMNAANPTANNEFKMDFDLGVTQTTVLPKPVNSRVQQSRAAEVTQIRTSADVDATSILTREVVKTAQTASPMDFDVSGILPGDVKSILQSKTTDFDISGALPGDIKNEAKSSTMDFDLTGSQPINVSQHTGAAPAAQSMNFEDLVFDIPASKPKTEEQPQGIKSRNLEFSLDIPARGGEPNSANPEASRKLGMDFGDININLDEGPIDRVGGEGKDEHWHEVATKLDLAKAYQEMGDADGAREILEEVIRDGDTSQRESAEKLIQQITA